MATRRVWITGASTGLGRALAERMARHGWTVAATARSAEALADLAAATPGVHAYACDVTDRDAMVATHAAIEAALGPLDLAVLNAGTHVPMGMEDFSSATVRRLIDINVMGVAHGLDCVLPGFVARRSGHVAIVASVAGYRGLPTAAAYGATKAALINLAESLRFDGRRLGVKVQIVNPGFVRTPLTDKNDFPMPFLMEPQDAARRLHEGLMGDAFEIAFPWRFVTLLRRLRCLPYSLYFAMVGRGTGK